MSEAKVKLAAVNQNPASMRDLLRIVIVGHVDHGKSTLVGRMFHDTGSLPDGKYEAIKAVCEKRGVPFEWAFLMDALQAERDQGLRSGPTGAEGERIKALEREVRELRQANEILRKASAYFAQAELDRRFKP